MAISSITLDEKMFAKLGVGFPELPLNPPLHMRSLRSLVVLAGANGAGKSRLLKLVSTLLPHQLDSGTRSELQRQSRSAQRGIEVYGEELERYSRVTPRDTEAADRIELNKRLIASSETDLEGISNRLEAGSIVTFTGETIPVVVQLVPRDSRLIDPASSQELAALQQAQLLVNLGTQGSGASAPAYVRKIRRAALQARDKRRSTGGAEWTQEETAEHELDKIFQTLLGADITPQLDGTLNLTVGSWRNYDQILSVGQQISFQFACILHAQGASLANCIVMMDEPENHLHPAVLNQVVDTICEGIAGGQVWIATHSIPLIAHLVAKDSDCMWYVENGRISHAGRSPERVLEGLMGGAMGAQQLEDLTRLPAQFAAFRFLSECLLPPGVKGAEEGDPQTAQIASILERMKKGSEIPVRLLDFGAGKARLLATLASMHKELQKWIDYFAFDPDPLYRHERHREISEVYGQTCDSRNLDELASLRSRISPGSVHAVVMCNVLHEISPSQWSGLFGSSGQLSGLLADDGYLLVVEDYGIPIGERAHEYGFLLLGEPELALLFCINEHDRFQQSYFSIAANESRYRDRLVVHCIHSTCVRRYTVDSRKAAIQLLHDRMAGVVEAFLRNGDTTATAGRNYARAAQLMANAAIWLQHN